MVVEQDGGPSLLPQLPLVDVVVPAAEASAVPGLRQVVVAFCELLAVEPDRTADIGLCVSEAVSNVVRHAYGDGVAGPLRVTADCEADALEVVVLDRGTGLTGESADPGLGLGLGIIARLASRFEVEQAVDGGTSVWMRFEL